jgi:hypothetical protein
MYRINSEALVDTVRSPFAELSNANDKDLLVQLLGAILETTAAN